MNYNENISENNYYDQCNINNLQIKSKDRVNNHGEVLTPEWLVKDMLDLLPKSVSKIDSRYLETSAGEGIFLIEVLRRKLVTIFNMYNGISDREYYTIVALCNIYGIELLKDNVEIARMRLEMLIKDFFINKNNMITSDSFFDIVKMILDINIINMDSMKFKEPVFDENNEIMMNDNGEFIYKNYPSCISEWEFDNEKKEVNRIEYYYEDVVNKQRQEYLKKNEKETVKTKNSIDLTENNEEGIGSLKVEQMTFFASSNIKSTDELENDKNIDEIVLKPVRVFKSVSYIKLLDLK